MIYPKSFVAVWNSIKKIPYLSNEASNDPLERTAVLPWIIDFFKNFSEEYQKNKRNSWEYQISRFHFNDSNNTDEKKRYLIERFNESLLFYSKDKKNPWCIDDKNTDFIKIYKKCCCSAEQELSNSIDVIIGAELAVGSLSKTNIQKRKNYLSELATLAHFAIESDKKTKKPIALYHLSHKATLNKFKKLVHYADSQSLKQKLKKFNKLKKSVTETKLLIVLYSRESESIKISLASPTFWEKTGQSTKKNIIFQFFRLIWNTLSSHANLLKWINFLLIFFSLSLNSFPLIILLIAGSALGYFALQFFFSLKTASSLNFPNLLSSKEEETLIQHIKQDVFNNELCKNEFSVIKKQIANSKVDITRLYEKLFLSQKTSALQILNKIQLQQSSIYQHLIRVYPKSQFISSLVINFTNIVLYGYIVSWALSFFFSAVEAVALASIISSPLGVGILILVPATFFLTRHLKKYCSREEHYENKVFHLLNSPCKYNFINKKGEKQKIQLKKWEKFECLKEEIRLLEENVTFLFKKNGASVNKPLYLLFKDIIKNDIYKFNDQDKSQREKIPFFTKIKKILSRSISFFAGGFYGYGLGQKIAVESSLGVRILLKSAALPVIILTLPLALINAIANLITYHLNARQKNRLFFAENLDSKLQNLEHKRKKLHYLNAFLDVTETNSVYVKQAVTACEKKNSAQLDFRKDNFNAPTSVTKFFRSQSTTHVSTLIENERCQIYTHCT
ncbi:MAG: hypothetical protein V4471_00065 [Pseudomonadota bacterium]